MSTEIYKITHYNVTYRWTTLRFCNFRVLCTPKHVEPSKTENLKFAQMPEFSILYWGTKKSEPFLVIFTEPYRFPFVG